MFKVLFSMVLRCFVLLYARCFVVLVRGFEEMNQMNLQC